MNYKEAIIEALKKFEKTTPDLIAILTLENPLRKKHYLEQAISNLIIHKSDLVIGTIPDFQNNYYKFTSQGIKLLTNQKNMKLKSERDIIHKDVGAFSIMKYSSYLNDDINKVTNIIMDTNDSFMVDNKADLLALNRIKKNN